jgi:hypothetical protein
MGHEATGLGLNMETFRSLFPDKGVRESYEKALGALVINFSLLHYLLEDFSHEVFAISEKTASIVLSDLPFTSMIKKLRACVKHRMPSESDRKEFLSILKRAEQTAEQRNELMHALWIVNEGRPVFCYRRRKKAQSQAPPIGEIKAHSQAPSISEVNALTRSILPLLIDLNKFTERETLSSPAVEVVTNALMEQKKKQP